MKEKKGEKYVVQHIINTDNQRLYICKGLDIYPKKVSKWVTKRVKKAFSTCNLCIKRLNLRKKKIWQREESRFRG